MKMRSTKMKKTVQSGCSNSSTSTGLDENLWGSLQYHINLAEDVYSKLPFEEFFHLRTVCKDWYVIACKHLGLKEPIHKPFFNLIGEASRGKLDGILIYNALSRSWNWRSGRTHGSWDEFVASKGVVFSYGLNFKSPSNPAHASVFHWQSKIYLDLELPPNPPTSFNCMVLGMIVSKKQGLLSSFKVVLGSPYFDTQVYESGVWQTKPCRVPKHETPCVWNGPCLYTGCVDCNGRVYISSLNTSVIFVYDFENANDNTASIRWEYGMVAFST